MQANPVLVRSYRGDTVECFYRGSACAVDAQGRILFAIGNPEQVSFPRSTLKYVQALLLIESGAYDAFGFTPRELAVMCASHAASPVHTETVQGILDKIGLTADDLQCSADPPFHHQDVRALYKSGREITPLHNTCSGKHSGFLAVCKHKGYDMATHLQPDHPLQKEIRALAAEFFGLSEDKLQLGIDGCNAPNYAVPLYNQAVAYQRLVQPDVFSERGQAIVHQIVDAVTTHPDMISGDGRYTTELMRSAGDRVIGKMGADGVYSVGLRKEKIGLVVKTDDGVLGPQYAITQELLELLGVLTEEEAKQLHHFASGDKYNRGGTKVGRMTVVEEAFEGVSRLSAG